MVVLTPHSLTRNWSGEIIETEIIRFILQIQGEKDELQLSKNTCCNTGFFVYSGLLVCILASDEKARQPRQIRLIKLVCICGKHSGRPLDGN